MADTTYSLTDDPDRGEDASFEAANAIPAPADEIDDEFSGRRPIDLDAPMDLSDEIAALSRPRRTRRTTPPPDAPADVPSDVPAGDDGMAPTEAEGALDEPDAPAVSSAEIDALRAQRDEAQAKLAQANDDKLRALADLQNFRRRGEEERARIIRDGNEKLIKELLPVLDDFDLALAHAQQTESYDQLIGGVSAILRKFGEVLAKQGVQPIAAQGEAFDPDLHEAVMLDEESDADDETITGELRKGYTMNNRVIRPSLVKVAKSG